MFKLNGSPINIERDLVIGEGDDAITIPAGSLLDAATRAQYGITEAPDPVRPDERRFWVSQNPDGSYNATPRPTEQITAPIWEQIKSERDRRRFDGGVKVGVHWYQSTAIATGEYTALALISSSLPDTTVLRAGWRTMDGSAINMTPVLVRQILAAGFAAVAAIDDAAQTHKAVMALEANPFEYNYSTGWPPVFGE